MRRVVALLLNSQMKSRSNGSLWVLLVLALLFYSAMAAEAAVIPGLTGTFFQFDFEPPPGCSITHLPAPESVAAWSRKLRVCG